MKIARSSGLIEEEVNFINEGRLLQGLGAAMEKALSPLDSECIIILKIIVGYLSNAFVIKKVQFLC